MADKSVHIERVEFKNTTNLEGTTTATGKLTTKVRNETFATSVAATGSDQSGAAEITLDGGIILITAADNTKGVKLPVVSGLTVGDRIKIVNHTANKTLKVYPGSGDRIFPAGANASIELAAGGYLEVYVAAQSGSEQGWVGVEGLVSA